MYFPPRFLHCTVVSTRIATFSSTCNSGTGTKILDSSDFRVLLCCRQQKGHAIPRGQDFLTSPDVQNGKSNSEKMEVHAGVGLNLGGHPCRDAWHNLGTLSQDDAMKRYITLVDKLDPGWEGKKDETSESSPNWTKVLNKG